MSHNNLCCYTSECNRMELKQCNIFTSKKDVKGEKNDLDGNLEAKLCSCVVTFKITSCGNYVFVNFTMNFSFRARFKFK